MMRVLHAFARCASGSAAVEAAVVVPVLLTIGLGAAETGHLVNENHRMKVGLAAGARMLARAQSPETLEDQARNLAVTGVRTGGTPRIDNWRTGHVQISYRWINNSTNAYSGGTQIRIIRLESTKPYHGLGFLSMVRPLQVDAVHEERWTG
jgi:hypothetical protein